MSRLSKLSSDAIKAMYSSESNQQLITLITITGSFTPPIRLANGFIGRINSLTTDTEIIYGVTSRSNHYIFIPMEISLPQEDDSGIGDCTLTLNYVTAEIISVIRQHLTAATPVTIELILSDNPNTVEAIFTGFKIVNIAYDATSISFTLSVINYNREPFPCYNFTPNYFPGLF